MSFLKSLSILKNFLVDFSKGFVWFFRSFIQVNFLVTKKTKKKIRLFESEGKYVDDNLVYTRENEILSSAVSMDFVDVE